MIQATTILTINHSPSKYYIINYLNTVNNEKVYE